MLLLALDLQPDAAVGHKPKLCIETLLLRFIGLLLSAALNPEHRKWG